MKYEPPIKIIPITKNISLFSNKKSNNAKTTLITTSETPTYFKTYFMKFFFKLKLNSYK